MRISTNTIYDLGVSAMQLQTQQLIQTQQQLSSGLRILSPADDPVAAAQALQVSQSQSINTQYGTNVNTASTSLTLEGSTLGSITTLLQSIRNITVQAGDPTLNKSDLATLANTLSGNYQDLLGLANSTDASGQYLFSGYQGNVRPFSQTAPGVVAYNGDQGQRLVQVSPSRQIAVSDAGADVFQRIPAGNGTFVTQAGGGNTGQGVIDAGTVLNPANWNAASDKSYSIDFAATATLTPAATNTAGGASGTAGIVDQTLWNAGSQNYSIAFTSPTTYNIVDNASNTTVVTGAAYTSGTPISFQGADVVITDGSGGVTPQAGDSFAIAPGAPPGLTYDIVDNASGKSMLTGLAAGAPPYARSFTPGASISLKSQGSEPAFDLGIATTIAGTPNAGDTFSINPSANQDVFKTIGDLVSLLQSAPSGAALTNGLIGAQQNLDNALQNISTAKASTGTRLNELDSAQTNVSNQNLQFSQTLSTLKDVDYTRAASDLAREQVNLQAAQQSFAKVAGLSLFSYL